MNRSAEVSCYVFHTIIIDIPALDGGLDRLGLLINLVKAQVHARHSVHF